MSETATTQQEAPAQEANSLPAATMPGRRGRLPGSPKVPGSGKRKGSLGVTNDLRMAIEVKGRPIEFLCKVVAGQRIRTGPLAGPGKPVYEYPTLNQRMRAAELLAAKILPDVRAIEHSGPQGTPLPPSVVVNHNTASVNLITRAALAMLGKSVPAIEEGEQAA